jgi:hypothetical protein
MVSTSSVVSGGSITLLVLRNDGLPDPLEPGHKDTQPSTSSPFTDQSRRSQIGSF